MSYRDVVVTPDWMPSSIEPGLSPYGIVVRMYDDAGGLLDERRIAVATSATALATVAEEASESVADEVSVFVVAYDGDDGHLMYAQRFADDE